MELATGRLGRGGCAQSSAPCGSCCGGLRFAREWSRSRETRMKRRHAVLSLLAFGAGLAAFSPMTQPVTRAADERGVRAWEAPLRIPTYPVGPAEPNPMFYAGRSYQGAKGPVYPYPLLDTADRRARGPEPTARLPGEPVRAAVVLPEIGGRIFAGRDKTNGYDFFYRQHVIKPALIGMVGAWISGGVEWNIPHHHRASTFMPVRLPMRGERRRQQDASGSARSNGGTA